MHVPLCAIHPTRQQYLLPTFLASSNGIIFRTLLPKSVERLQHKEQTSFPMSKERH
jgi:hypothetical protein